MPDTTAVRITLRLPAEIGAEVARLAKLESRSLNGQITQMLREAVQLREKNR